jgi:hypothetical protein
MAELLFICPKTKQRTTTGIETDVDLALGMGGFSGIAVTARSPKAEITLNVRGAPLFRGSLRSFSAGGDLSKDKRASIAFHLAARAGGTQVRAQFIGTRAWQHGLGGSTSGRRAARLELNQPADVVAEVHHPDLEPRPRDADGVDDSPAHTRGPPAGQPIEAPAQKAHRRNSSTQSSSSSAAIPPVSAV